jgi:hypothetical protein
MWLWTSATMVTYKTITSVFAKLVDLDTNHTLITNIWGLNEQDFF